MTLVTGLPAPDLTPFHTSLSTLKSTNLITLGPTQHSLGSSRHLGSHFQILLSVIQGTRILFPESVIKAPPLSCQHGAPMKHNHMIIASCPAVSLFSAFLEAEIPPPSNFKPPLFFITLGSSVSCHSSSQTVLHACMSLALRPLDAGS